MFLIERAINLQGMLLQKGKGWGRQQIHPVFKYCNGDEVFYILEMNSYLTCVIYQKAVYIPLRYVTEAWTVAFNSEK